MSQISVIIVSWNAKGYLRDCLLSIRTTAGSCIREVIVVDNASRDGSPEMVLEQFPEVTLLQAGENLGFARANNHALKRAAGSLVALINSDVVVHPNCFEQLAAFMESHPEAGLVGPRVFGRDGRLQLSCSRLPTVWNTACEFFLLSRAFPHWPFLAGFQMRPHEHEKLAPVEVLSGCFWLARRAAVEQVGGLDERFFFYAEDVDWCKRFRDAGWKLFFVPQASATHFGGGSSSKAPLRFSIELLRANLAYWQKHHGQLGRCAYFVLAMAQHSVRFLIRLALKVSGRATDESKYKLQEHAVCLRWLLTGKGG